MEIAVPYETTTQHMDTSAPDVRRRSGAWIRYRIEHRDRITDNLIEERETDSFDSDDILSRSNHAGSCSEAPIFEVLRTFQLTKAESLGRNQVSVATCAPLYSVQLYSPALINALRSIVKYYPSQDLTGDIVVKWPYCVLVHHYDELYEYASKCETKDQKELCIRDHDATAHIRMLLKFLDENVMEGVREELERNARGFYTWEYQWLMCRPGRTLSYVIKSIHGHQTAVCHSITGGIFENKNVEWNVHAWGMDFDGQFVGRTLQSTRSPRIDGEISIEELFRFGDMEDPGKSENQEAMDRITYGKAYWKYMQKQCCYHSGEGLDFPHNKIEGLIMVDAKASTVARISSELMDDTDGRVWVSDCTCTVCRLRFSENIESRKGASIFERYNWISTSPEDLQSDMLTHMYLLLPFEVSVFVFRTRTWEKVHVKNIHEPVFEETMIENLVMDEKRKKTLKSLSKSFARTNKLGQAMSQEAWSADFVKGKGHGLIFLLHGKPGVGKTCTAECIAAFVRRPLMVLTSSDIGTDPTEIEINLTRQFKLARSWGAVLLIDEADVFMERRSTADLQRNSLVAGFLRALEFYEGILFLTTNRVGSFDDAFISRVHIQLYYPDFTDEQRQQVWKTFMDKLAKEKGNYIRLSQDAKDYTHCKAMRQLKWNGREIRNAFQTAVSLAEYDSVKGEDGKIMVTDEHLRAVVELSKDFKGYLDELHVADESKRALLFRERNDEYSQSQSHDI